MFIHIIAIILGLLLLIFPVSVYKSWKQLLKVAENAEIPKLPIILIRVLGFICVLANLGFIVLEIVEPAWWY